MNGTLLVAHIRNEEYLLPFFLNHHKHMFDHGVIIDYASTDRSLEICADLVPNWEVRRSRNRTWDPVLCDREVMDVELEWTGWKIALNVTEFLCGDLDALVKQLRSSGHEGVRIRPIVMIDSPEGRDVEPNAATPLMLSRPHGIISVEGDERARDYRARLFHSFADGWYAAGRHSTGHTACDPEYPDDMIVCWFAYSPWTPAFRERKLAVNVARPHKDPGSRNYNDLEQDWIREIPHSVNLLAQPEFTHAMAAWTNRYSRFCGSR